MSTTEIWSDERIAAGRRAWRFSLAGTMISSLGTGLTLPFLFVYLHGVRHISLPLAGTIVAVGAVAAFALAPVSGSLSDRLGLGRLIVVGMTLMGLSGVLLAAPVGSGGFAVVVSFVAVALESGGSAMTWPTMNGLVAAQLPPDKRPHAFALRFGILNAGIGIGGLVSGLFVSVAHPATFELIYLLDAASTFAFAAIVVVFLRTSPGFGPVAVDAGAQEHAQTRTHGGYRAVLRDRAFVAFLAVNFLLFLFGYAQLNGPFGAYATLVVGAGPRAVGFAFAANTAAIVVTQLLVSRLTHRWRRSRMLLVAGGIFTLAWAITLFADLPGLGTVGASVALVVSLGVFGLGETMYAPVEGGLPNELAPDELRGRYNAASFTMSSVAGLIGPQLAGVLLGSATPITWAIVATVGMGVTSLGALALGRLLPESIDRPALAADSV
ncbi:MFS transporter [Frondihabitans australicus]|uniref:Na+/melibiose symporter-like transporter n=1 Tax=Frondihabitans australicus TaxID=386892 RepID=A0A495IC79_9MICO|nr:MFS transporter [Frondihabitans australicus]RKR73529.1 Na+/melibiose symporter-like transporter [Frondihabitans australicus]